MKLEEHANSKKETSIKAGLRIIGCLQPSAELLAQASVWDESIACTCFAIKYIQFF